MTPSHPNRSPQHGRRNPSPLAVREWRESQGLSTKEAAALVHSTDRVWRQWEAGDRSMHPAFWELAQVKRAQQVAELRALVQAENAKKWDEVMP